MKSNQLRLLINSYYDMQDQRIRMGNQIRSLEKEKEEHETLKNYYSRFYDIEKDVSKDIKKAIKDHPMYPFCEETKGMGHILSACLLSS